MHVALIGTLLAASLFLALLALTVQAEESFDTEEPQPQTTVESMLNSNI